jgi:hypothetical protein
MKRALLSVLLLAAVGAGGAAAPAAAAPGAAPCGTQPPGIAWRFTGHGQQVVAPVALPAGSYVLAVAATGPSSIAAAVTELGTGAVLGRVRADQPPRQASGLLTLDHAARAALEVQADGEWRATLTPVS